MQTTAVLTTLSELHSLRFGKLLGSISGPLVSDLFTRCSVCFGVSRSSCSLCASTKLQRKKMKTLFWQQQAQHQRAAAAEVAEKGFTAYKACNDVRRCSCGHGLEKIDGCDHVTCATSRYCYSEASLPDCTLLITRHKVNRSVFKDCSVETAALRSQLGLTVIGQLGCRACLEHGLRIFK